MRIILSFSDAHKLDHSERDKREAIAREQFSDAGLKLDQSRCHMIWAGNDEGPARDRLRQSLRRVVNKWQDGDIAYVDHEPVNYSLSAKFEHRIVNTHAELINAAKFAIPGDNNVSVYGFPYSMWWNPWSTPQAVYSTNFLHRKTKLGWFGPQFYQPYNIGDKNGIDNLKRALTMRNLCESIDNTRRIIPFVQPMIRHPDDDRRPMTDETIFDMWASLVWAGIREVVWWYESGGNNQFAEGHAEQIKRHAAIMSDAIKSTYPGGNSGTDSH